VGILRKPRLATAARSGRSSGATPSGSHSVALLDREQPMPRIVVQPQGITFDAEPGETIMGAAIRNGYWWPTTCGGHAECAVCAVVVEEGAEHLSPINDGEVSLLPTVPQAVLHPNWTVRLACQAHVSGDVVVTKRGVRLRATPGR
jgi:2Fe-2S ferredoxin